MKKALLILLLVLPILAQAAMIIETIELHYRPTEEIIPIIQPMLDKDASITGTGYKLIIKSTPSNIEQIKTLIKELDADQTQLLIHVVVNNKLQMDDSDTTVNLQAGGQGSSIRIGTQRPQAAAGDVHVAETARNRDQPIAQVVRVSEGYWASIQMGQAIPVTSRTRNSDGTVTETVTWRNVTSDFRVMPRTHGDQVTLTIMPHNDSLNPATPNRINISGMETTLTGKIGQWIHLGGTQQTTTTNSTGINYRTAERDSAHNQIWLKVERP